MNIIDIIVILIFVVVITDGIVNVLNCSLWNGATCDMLPGKFDAGKTWRALLRSEDPFTIFMAVPTVYNNLARYFKDGKL